MTTNPIINALITSNDMFVSDCEISPEFSLSEDIYKALTSHNIKVTYHFDVNSGALVFDKVLGRDENGDFYNRGNANLEARKQQAKEVIVKVLLEKYNSLAK